MRTSIQPTEVTPTSVNPTPINPTSITPTPIEPGILYINVDENRTFNLEYNGNAIVNGTWTDEGDDYAYLHHDPDGVLMSLYENYRIRENHLYIYGGTENYFVKV